MKILGIYDSSGPKYHRIALPLHQMPGVEFVLTRRLSNDEQLKGIDIVFFNRKIFGIGTLNALVQLRDQMGFKLICDLDDHWNLDPTHVLYNHYKDHNLSEIIKEHIRVSDAITVTHERLCYEALKINKNVHILANAIPKEGQFLFEKQQDEKLRLFWAGSITHRKDLELLRNPSKRINSNKVKWVIGGYNAKEPEWQKIASIFKNKDFDLELLESLPVDTYYACYSKCDIALIPLIDNSFNCYKSNLKILEAANIGAPVVVSKVNPYLGFPEHYVNYVERQGDWYVATNGLINDKNFRHDQGQDLKEYCDINYNFNKINQHRKQVFYDTIQRC